MSIKPHVPGSTYAALNAMIDEIGTSAGTSGAEAAGDFEDVTKFTILKQMDPDQPRIEMSFARVVRLSKHFNVTAALKHFAEQMGCVVVPVASAAANVNFMSHLATLAKECSEGINALAEALRSHEQDEEALLNIEKECQDVIVAAQAALMTAKARRTEARKVTAIRGSAA